MASGSAVSSLLKAACPVKHDCDCDIKDRANAEAAEDANGHVALRLAGFFRRGGNGVESDVSKKDDRRAAGDAIQSMRREGRPVFWFHVKRTHDEEEHKDDQFEHDHGRVEPGAFLDAEDQQPGQQP